MTEPATKTGRLFDLLLQALPAVGGTIGFVGFVAVIGGAVEWIRFRAAALPADQAVQVVPREQLVTIGAVSIVAFTLLGLMAVLIAYLIDRRGDASAPTWRGVVALSGAGLIATVVIADLRWWVVIGIVLWILAVALLSVGTIDRAAQRWLIRRRVGPRTLRSLLDAGRRLNAAEARFLTARYELTGPRWPPDLEQLAIAERRAASALWVAIRELERLATQIISEAGGAAPPAGDETPPPDADPGPWGEKALRHRTRLARDLADRARRVAVRPADERVAQNLRDQMTYAKDHGLRALVELRHAGLIAAGCVFALAGIAALLAHYAEGELWLIPVGLLPLVTVGLQRIRLFTFTLTAVGTVFLLVFDESRWLVIMVVVVAVLAAAILAVAHVTSRFAWYGIAVFLAVQLFGAALEATRIARFPQLQPVALVRKSDDIGICGVYITQTSDRIYVGHVEVSESDRDDADPGSGRIFWVSRDDVDLVSLGPLLDIQYVNTRAAAMLREVYRDRAAEVPARTQPAEKTEQTTRETKSGQQTTTKTTTKITRDKRPSPRPKGVRTPPDCNTLDAKPLS